MGDKADYAFLGWQGFALEHPAAWELNRVRGSRQASYLAFDDGERVRLEIDWKPVSRKAAVESLVDRQVKTLEKAAKRRRIDFRVERRRHLGRVRGFDYEAYVWRADVSACEMVARCGRCRRAILLRVVGDKDRPPEPEARDVFSSLECQCGRQSERWGTFGLDVRVPSGFELDQSSLKAGMCELVFTDRKTELRVLRVSLGRMILETKKMVPWYEEIAEAILKPFETAWKGEDFRGHLGYWGEGLERTARRLLKIFRSKRRFCAQLSYCEPSDKIFVVSADGTDDVAKVVKSVREGLVCHR